jgi:hypothetical protein
MQSDEKQHPLLQTAIRELNAINSPLDTIESLLQITNAQSQIIESLYEGKPNLKMGEVFIETLSMKILLATKSVMEISKGFHIETNAQKSAHRLLDFPSIHVLTRSMIESMLTLEYLFYNNLDDSEKEFRFLVWRISGYKSRQEFFNTENRKSIGTVLNKKLQEELNELSTLLSQAKAYPYFNDLSKQSLWKLDKFGLPRMKSWSELLESSSLSTEIFLIPYKLYSNYAHSEFISLIQMNGVDILNKDSKENTLHLVNALRVVKMINSVAIVALANKFNCTAVTFNTLKTEQKEVIQFWNGYATGRY